jgi:hypothetical protein
MLAMKNKTKVKSYSDIIKKFVNGGDRRIAYRELEEYYAGIGYSGDGLTLIIRNDMRKRTDERDQRKLAGARA